MGWIVVLLLVIAAVLLFGRRAVAGVVSGAAQRGGAVVVLAVVIAVAISGSGKAAVGWALGAGFAALILWLFMSIGQGIREFVDLQRGGAGEESAPARPPFPEHGDSSVRTDTPAAAPKGEASRASDKR